MRSRARPVRGFRLVLRISRGDVPHAPAACSTSFSYRSAPVHLGASGLFASVAFAEGGAACSAIPSSRAEHSSSVSFSTCSRVMISFRRSSPRKAVRACGCCKTWSSSIPKSFASRVFNSARRSRFVRIVMGASLFLPLSYISDAQVQIGTLPFYAILMRPYGYAQVFPHSCALAMHIPMQWLSPESGVFFKKVVKRGLLYLTVLMRLTVRRSISGLSSNGDSPDVISQGPVGMYMSKRYGNSRREY